MKTQLLATFTNKTDLDKIIEKIKGAYTIAFGKIYVLQNENSINVTNLPTGMYILHFKNKEKEEKFKFLKKQFR